MLEHQLSKNNDSNSSFTNERFLAFLIICVSILIFICNTVIPQTKKYKCDFACIYTTWYAASHGLDYYDTSFGKESGVSKNLTKIANEVGIQQNVPYYVYSPAFAVLGRFMPLISYRSAEIISVWSNSILWLACIGYLVHISFPDKELIKAIFFFLGTIFPPVVFTIEIGQTNIAVFLLILAIGWALTQNNNIIAGLCVGMAMLAKTHLGLFIIYFAIRKRWTAIISALAFGLFMLVFSTISLDLEHWQIYITQILPKATAGMAYIANQSVQGVIARIFIDNPNFLFSDAVLEPSFLLSLTCKSVGLIIIVLTIWTIKNKSGKLLQLEVATITLASLLATPVANLHHFTWVFFAIIILWSKIITEDFLINYRHQFTLAIATVLLFLPWQTFFQLFLGYANWLRFFACNTFVGTLLIWIVSLSFLRIITCSKRPYK